MNQTQTSLSRDIKAMRERQQSLARETRKILDENHGGRFGPDVQKIVDANFAEIDSLERRLVTAQEALDKQFCGFNKAEGIEWRNAETGEKIPVAYASKGNFRDQLQTTFPSMQQDGNYSAKIGVGDFLRGVCGMRLTEPVRNALVTGTDTAGGFTLPHYLQLQMLEAMVPVSSLLTAGAGVARLDQGAKSFRIAAVDTIPTASWRLESGAVAISEPVFRGVDIEPKSLSFQFKISRELLADSNNLDQALFNAIAQAFAKEMDRAGLRGSGTVPEVRGILNTSGIQSVTNGADGASITATAYSNFISALQKILEADGPVPTAAIMSPRSLTILAGLLDTTDQPRQQPKILDDVKFITTSQIPNNLTVGASNDCSEIYMGDFSSVIYFMREGVSVQLLKELYAGTGEVGFACHTRVDVGITYPAALSVVTGVRP